MLLEGIKKMLELKKGERERKQFSYPCQGHTVWCCSGVLLSCKGEKKRWQAEKKILKKKAGYITCECLLRRAGFAIYGDWEAEFPRGMYAHHSVVTPVCVIYGTLWMGWSSLHGWSVKRVKCWLAYMTKRATISIVKYPGLSWDRLS